MAKTPLVIRFSDPKRAEALAELLRGGTSEFTTIVSTKDLSVGRFDTAFLGLDPGRVDYLARIAAGNKIATYQRRVSLSDFVEIGMTIKEWALLVPRSKQDRLIRFLQEGGRFTDALWRDAIEGLLKAKPEIGDALKEHQLKTVAAARPINIEEVESTLLERDAVGFAIETWGGSSARKKAMLASRSIAGRASFLQHLGEADLREIDAIEHDSATIPGYELIKKYLVGAAEFVGLTSKLTVLNANLKPLETVLGVDLIYYNHCFRSFVLIQYKRMSHTVKDRPCYRPEQDGNFKPECDRIDAWRKDFKARPRQPVNHHDYRLGPDPFFFKFCDLKRAEALDTSLAPGFYLPYRFMRRLLKSKASLGKRGGRLISWDTGRRVLSNKRMMEMIQGGWVGSSGSITAKLNEVIGGVLTGNRSLIYAISAPLRGATRIHRDVMGKYATEDDESAHAEIQ